MLRYRTYIDQDLIPAIGAVRLERLTHETSPRSPFSWPTSSTERPTPAFATRYSASTAPALTVIITGIYDDKWLLEIEAIATA